MREILTHGIIYYVSGVSPSSDNPKDELIRRTLLESGMPGEDILSTKSLEDHVKRWEDGGKDYVRDALNEESDRYRVIIIDDGEQTPVNDYNFVTSVVSGMDSEVWVLPVLGEISRGIEKPSDE